ncbi:acyltransferase family protein [Methylosinus sp. Sm6]|uniref:acyltransferase family protein n=1 Tax=Methylosinus sp. Sm6 TaxID=2866948 RepID=UPI001C98F710|nr:acyltransferase family protein [Methylosinus sp. Sm6]MBY6241292.1 acyltransferase [Methylosinus sp. Sm6]
MKYRYEIDGLRAVAVASVILYHAGFENFKGGFVGVDVFFVISGYLITKIVSDGLNEKSFSICAFFERRMRRILPALYIVMLFSILLAWRYMLAPEMVGFGRSVMAVVFFVSNIFFSRNIDYFASDVETAPLIHAWSLSVEEQFYLVFPIIAAIWVARGWSLIYMVASLTVISFALAEWASKTHPAFDFYYLPTRAWELGVGAMVALAPWHRLRLGQGVHEAASIAGLSAIVLSVAFLDRNIPFPGVFALAPVIGAALVIGFAHPDTFCGRLLGVDPLVRVGLLSYSAYLWHQPLFAFARLGLLSTPSKWLLLLIGGVALCLAYVSWRYVESPCRDKRLTPTRPLAFGAVAAGLALCLFGIAMHHYAGVPGRYSPGISAIAAGLDYRIPRFAECLGDFDHVVAPDEACEYHPQLPSHIAIWGDSHSASIAGALAAGLAEQGASLKQFNLAACPPIRGVHIFLSERPNTCNVYNDKVFSYISDHAELKTIILYARWPTYMDGNGYDNGEGGRSGRSGHRAALPATEGAEFVDDPRRVEAVGALLRANVEKLLSIGRNVVVVYPTPEIGCLVPRCMAQRRLTGRDGPVSVSYAFFQDRTFTFRDQIDRFPDRPNLLRVKPEAVFCNRPLAGRCIAESDEAPLYYDDNHLNDAGASLLTRLIVAELRRKGWL